MIKQDRCAINPNILVSQLVSFQVEDGMKLYVNYDDVKIKIKRLAEVHPSSSVATANQANQEPPGVIQDRRTLGPLSEDQPINQHQSSDLSNANQPSPVIPNTPSDRHDDLRLAYEMLPQVMEVISNMEPQSDRCRDFLSVLKAIANNQLEGNLALHLLLNVGQF